MDGRDESHRGMGSRDFRFRTADAKFSPGTTNLETAEGTAAGEIEEETV